MIFKIMAFAAAAIPMILFVRSMFFRRTARINDGLKEFKKQADLAVSIFLILIGLCCSRRRRQVGVDVVDDILNACRARIFSSTAAVTRHHGYRALPLLGGQNSNVHQRELPATR
jgi:glucan phosphoethanolaminetransferase (alkaline phosphatase superfamily)